MTSRADGCAPSTYIFWLPDSTAPSAGEYNVDVSGANLSQPPFSKELGDAEINT
jgi:hypothetical protein